MPTLTIDLPESMKDFVLAKVAERGYSDASEFMVELVRVYQQREDLEQKLLAAVESNDFQEVTPEFWDRLRTGVNEGNHHDGAA